MTDKKSVYSEDSIQLLNPMDHIRLRPGMYVGGTDKNALHHLFHEILDNSIDEAIAGHCDHIWITLKPNNELSVRDNGQGIPTNNTSYGKNTLELFMTSIGACGKGISENYHVSGGLHGVGISAVNALCAECTAEVARDGYLWRQTYQAGSPATQVLQIRSLAEDELTGTHITIRPDFTILEPNDFDYEILADRAREVAYLLPTLTLTLRDERQKDVREDVYHFADGVSAYVAYLNQLYPVLNEPFDATSEWATHSKKGESHSVQVEVAFQYADTLDSKIVGYVNTVRTIGGYHTDILPSVLLTIINERAAYLKLEPFSTAEVMTGLTAVVSVWHPHPSFESQTNITFIRSDIQDIVTATTEFAISSLYANEFKSIVEKLLANREALKNK